MNIASSTMHDLLRKAMMKRDPFVVLMSSSVEKLGALVEINITLSRDGRTVPFVYTKTELEFMAFDVPITETLIGFLDDAISQIQGIRKV